jgi:hypothetical protein
MGHSGLAVDVRRSALGPCVLPPPVLAYCTELFRFRNRPAAVSVASGHSTSGRFALHASGRSGRSSRRGRSVESRRASRRPGAGRRSWICWARPHSQATVEWSGHPDGGSEPEWRNGRRGGLKHRCPLGDVWVRSPPPAPRSERGSPSSCALTMTTSTAPTWKASGPRCHCATIASWTTAIARNEELQREEARQRKQRQRWRTER